MLRLHVLLRLLKNSLIRRPRTILLMLVSLTLGSAVATSFLGISGDLARRMALELRSYGANILVEPLAAEQGGELNEADLPRIKSVFWRYNIIGFAPYLFGTATLRSGERQERGVATESLGPGRPAGGRSGPARRTSRSHGGTGASSRSTT